MQITDVPYPGLISNGLALRREAAKALSAAQITSMNTPGGKSALAGRLRQFFIDCAGLLDGIADGVAPTMTDALVGTQGANTVELRFDEDMDPGIPRLSHIVMTGTFNTVVGAAWLDAQTLVVTMQNPYTAESTVLVNYTGDSLRDVAGNALLPFGGVAADNLL